MRWEREQGLSYALLIHAQDLTNLKNAYTLSALLLPLSLIFRLFTFSLAGCCTSLLLLLLLL
jgi:hypothetical protein